MPWIPAFPSTSMSMMALWAPEGHATQIPTNAAKHIAKGIKGPRVHFAAKRAQVDIRDDERKVREASPRTRHWT